MNGWTLLVTSHGRWDYLTKTLDALHRSVGLDFFDRRCLSLDGTHGPVDVDCLTNFTEVERLPMRLGLTANLTQAWGMLGPAERVFHLEEDFLVLDAPLQAMSDVLERQPSVANMVLVRQPWGPHEIAAGSVLAAQEYELYDRGEWLQHQGGFWLNPGVYLSDTVRGLTPGVEQTLTKQCLRLGKSFGYWGHLTDDPRVVHIGSENGMGSPGWLA